MSDVVGGDSTIWTRTTETRFSNTDALHLSAVITNAHSEKRFCLIYYGIYTK
jgi:hypothetical protein